MSIIRVDNNLLGYNKDFISKNNTNANNFNNRENISGKVVDVNQNMVTIQTSNGNQFVATTTIPMENLINQYIDFELLYSQDGQVIISPQIDESKNSELEKIKIQDILLKLGKNISDENSEIIKSMLSSSIPITKENFEQVKEMKFSLNLLQSEDFAVNLSNEEMTEDLVSLVKEIQNKKDFGIAEKSTEKVIDEKVSLKDILILKNIDIKVSPNNIKLLTQLVNQNSDLKGDLLGLKKLLSDTEFIESIKSSTNFDDLLIDDNKSNNLTSLLLENAEDFSFEDMEKLNTIYEDIEFGSFDDELSGKNISKENLISSKMDSEEILSLLKAVQKNLTKKVNDVSIKRSDDFKIDFATLKEDIKSVISSLSQKSEASQVIEKQIYPKLDILSNLLEKYNYNIIPFKTEQNYENTLEYYVKKDKKSLKKQDEFNIGLSLDTNNYGNVKAMVNYNKNHSIKLDFFTENKKVQNLFENNIGELKSILKKIGFSNIELRVNIKNTSNSLIEDVTRSDDTLKSYEFYV